MESDVPMVIFNEDKDFWFHSLIQYYYSYD